MDMTNDLTENRHTHAHTHTHIHSYRIKNNDISECTEVNTDKSEQQNQT